MKKETGGPAFPHIKEARNEGGAKIIEWYKGMTLLDYFAGKALDYFISNSDHQELSYQGMKKEEVCERLSRSSYELASKMIEEREKWKC